MKKWIRRAAALCLTLCIFLTAAACGGDKTADAVITYGMDERPTTLDPQLASSETEQTMVRNLFEGLFRLDAEGNIVEGAAESYTLSEDGLTYTFTLREAVWQDDTPVTAADFVFGLQRAVDPVTNAPYSSLLSAIDGASAILAGGAAVDTLGVTAVDEHTLTIRLHEPDPDFPMVLTLAVSMPCNEAFFQKAAGAYGRNLDATASNGSFTLYRWEEDATIRLNRNRKYNGPFPAKPAAVVFATGREKQTNDPDADLSDTAYRLARLRDGTLDAGKVDNSQAAALSAEGFSITAYEDTCWAVAVNPNTEIGTADMQKALRESINRNVCDTSLPSYFTRADRYLPESLTLRGEAYKESQAVQYTFPYDSADARAILAETTENQENGRLPSVTLLYADEPGMEEAASVIAQQWQQNMGLYCNIEGRSRSSLQSAVAAGEYQLALVPLYAGDNTVQSFFKQFTEGGLYAGFVDSAFTDLMSGMTGSISDEGLFQLAGQLESQLLNCTGLTPVFFSSSAFALSPQIQDLQIQPFSGRADFSFTGRLPD